MEVLNLVRECATIASTINYLPALFIIQNTYVLSKIMYYVTFEWYLALMAGKRVVQIYVHPILVIICEYQDKEIKG